MLHSLGNKSYCSFITAGTRNADWKRWFICRVTDCTKLIVDYMFKHYAVPQISHALAPHESMY
jgi:hypothetical protein